MASNTIVAQANEKVNMQIVKVRGRRRRGGRLLLRSKHISVRRALEKTFERVFEVTLKNIPVNLGSIPRRFVTGKLFIKTLREILYEEFYDEY